MFLRFTHLALKSVRKLQGLFQGDRSHLPHGLTDSDFGIGKRTEFNPYHYTSLMTRTSPTHAIYLHTPSPHHVCAYQSVP